MTRLLKAAAFAGALALAGPAIASPLPPITGDYEGSYGTESVNTGGNDHTFWLPGLLDGPANAYWQFMDGTGSFTFIGGVAKLTGTIVNNTDATKKFTVDVNFSERAAPAGGPKCQLGGQCNSAAYMFQEQFFDFFSYETATLTGIDMLDGLVLGLIEAPADKDYPPQLGYGANNKDLNEFGLSTWFYWNTLEGENLSFLNKASGQGDINLELTAVPIPAALPLLAGGLGLMGFVSWRRKRALS